ncbi:NFACT family protein [Candidatus Woesearchaeota archaeon]|nr:NFACT family protein [Candidatus Woesearchaeota archaeon]
MKTQLSGPDIQFVCTELQGIIGSRITRITQQGSTFCIETYKTGAGAQHIIVALPRWVYLSTTKAASGTAGAFCLYLRKHLEGGKILSITQPGLERIIQIAISTKEDRYTLIIELFSRGNLIVIDHDQVIRGVLTEQTFKDRSIVRGGTYRLPPGGIDASTLDLGAVKDIVRTSSRETISQTIAMDLGLGGSWAMEVCARAHVNPKAATGDPRAVYDALQSVFTAPPEAWLVLSKDEVVDCTPIRFNSHADAPLRKLSSFSEGIAILQRLASAPKTTAIDTQINTTQIIIDKQEEHRRELVQEIADTTRKGELIYEHYQNIQTIFTGLREARKTMSWQEIKKKLHNQTIVDVNEAKGTITIEL